MATTYDADSARMGTRPTGAGIIVVADRSESFRQARRHSKLVRILRLALPMVGVALVLGYLGALVGTGGFAPSLPEMAMPRITPKDLSMQNPNYEGVTADGGSYRVAAARARQDFDRTDVIQLEEITGDLVAKDKSATKLTASRGVFNHKESVLQLSESIQIRGDNGFSADLTAATVLTREGRINSDEPVSVGFPAGSVRARRLEIRQKVREVTFVEEVVARLVPPPRKVADAAAAGAASPPSPTALFGASDGPVDITSARLDIQDNDKKAIFTGNVRAAQAQSALETPEMTVLYDGGAGPGGTPAPTPGGGKLTRIEAKGPFVMTRGATDRVTGNAATFDAVSQTALLDGNIVMTAVPNRRVTADRVELDQKTDGAVLTGRVEVVNGETVLTGRRLSVDRKNGRTSLTSPPMSGSGPGRITAHFVQKATGAKKPEPAANPAAAGIAQFKTSPDAPLDIEADSLDVDDTARVAIFRGDVVTRQGEVTMRSAEIKAFYTGSARLADVGGGATAEPSSSSELSRIDANGRVNVTTADGRKVTGDWAKYEAKANNITIGGDVELSQGTSVVRGKRLVIDMRTGKATIDTSSPKVVEKPADGWSTEAAGRSTGGRPSAIFFPDELRKAQQGAAGKKKPAEPSPAPDASGWNSQTTPSPPRP
ncbi:MAG: LPS export ABC transporter periplasmic protein LptC [Hyphomonas sp.]|nr:LPS export ABC transporter periplasmic protein LptC [Hyphomonas sp.]